jgi:hypothetical protein
MTPLAITPAPQPVPSVVDLLETLLASAKAGELRELAVASRLTGNRVGTAHVGEYGEDAFRMLGALRYLEHRTIGLIER